MLDKIDEEALEVLGLKLRDENGNDRPSEIIVREFMDLWPTFTSDQKLNAEMMILIIRKRHS